ncbi:MAG: beta-lactamase family protein [Acidobacteria bacterium]|nr:beta-lactamase family protein [Acidobacteriota bacterium]
MTGPVKRACLLIGVVLVGMTGAFSGVSGQTAVPAGKANVAVPAELVTVRTKILERIQSDHIPSFAIGVVRNGKVIWEEGLGWADQERKIPATAESLYAAASVSKSITATGTLALVGKGRFKLDQSVDSILGAGWAPPIGYPSQDVLISHLLAHTSGIPHLWHYQYPDVPASLVGRDVLIQKYAFQAAPPGQRYVYTNLGYGVLAKIIEKAGNAPFQRVMKQSLFRPLGMQQTTTDAWLGDKKTVRGYSGDGKVLPYRFRLGPDGGAGFFSTAHDLTRYALFHLGAIAPAAHLGGASISTELANLPVEKAYYRGWGVVKLPTSTLLISDGQMAGGTAVVILVPEQHAGVVVLSNATGSPSAEVAVDILNALIPEFGAQFGAAIGELEQKLTAPGQIPTGRFKGSLKSVADEVPVSLDLTNPALPVFELGGSTFVLRGISWERGAMQATVTGSLAFARGRDRTHNLVLTMWLHNGELQGIAQEDFTDDRSRSGVPYRLILKPVP